MEKQWTVGSDWWLGKISDRVQGSLFAVRYSSFAKSALTSGAPILLRRFLKRDSASISARKGKSRS
jgi:hypothetical protein